MDRDQYLYLTTRGRTTGKPREIEIWFSQEDRRFYVIAEHPTSNWVRNIRAEPAVSLRVGSTRFSGDARLVDVESEQDLAGRIRALFREKYGWGNGQIVEITPRSELH